MKIQQLPDKIRLRLYHGGYFYQHLQFCKYEGGTMLLGVEVDSSKFTVESLHQVAKVSLRLDDGFTIWFRRFGFHLGNGKKILENNGDVDEILSTIDEHGYVNLYVVVESDSSGSNNVGTNVGFDVVKGGNQLVQLVPIHTSTTKSPRIKNASYSDKNPHPKLTPRRKISKSASPPKIIYISEEDFYKGLESRRSPTLQVNSPPPRLSPTTHQINSPPPQCSPAPLQIYSPPPQFCSPSAHLSSPSTHISSQPLQQIRSPRLLSKSREFSPINIAGPRCEAPVRSPRKRTGTRSSNVGSGPRCTRRKEYSAPVAPKNKVKKNLATEYFDSIDPYESDVDLSDDEFEDIIGNDLFSEDCGASILEDVCAFVSEGLREMVSHHVERDIGEDFDAGEELSYDSEELRSLDGSDSESQQFPTFNPETDFGKPINLRAGLRFPNVEILRCAIQQHAIENKYDYYNLHNGTGRWDAYCVDRCTKCPWNKKRSRRENCSCINLRCTFYLYATKMKGEDTMQLKTCKLDHQCWRKHKTRKLTSKFLAMKYLEVWRNDPDWDLMKGLKARVKADYSVIVGYHKCWYARARAKLMLYGDCSEQYKRIWDYAVALRKYNEGIVAMVGVEQGVERPLFDRFFVCLKPVLDGFLEGCRPIIGLDGCHLSGPYPGICLTAVGKDGNNNIYPLAWGIVSGENNDTWSWFIELLASALGAPIGKGYTFMSDRQKGLVSALAKVILEASTRYCWRHLWCNFKQKYSGEAYKCILWAAAKSTTKASFNSHMDELKELNEEAYKYMAKIPTSTWSRHAFDNNCKSNMLLNNMCESFNNVLKPARDKAILTHMEWMRRYLMQRHHNKREGAKTLKGTLMPYVKDQFDKALDWMKDCVVRVASKYKFEVEHKETNCLVDLETKTCSCYRWQLTGIPCHHAYACIVESRGDPNEWVDDYYSVQRYTKAYNPVVNPMPGLNDWEKTNHTQPDPPVYQRLPGRPSKKKRRLEECEKKKNGGKKQKGIEHAQREVGKQNKCSICKEPEHNKKTCKKEAPKEPPPKKKACKALSRDPWNVRRRELQVKGKGKGKGDKGITSQSEPTTTQPDENAPHGTYPDSPPPVGC